MTSWRFLGFEIRLEDEKTLDWIDLQHEMHHGPVSRFACAREDFNVCVWVRMTAGRDLANVSAENPSPENAALLALTSKTDTWNPSRITGSLYHPVHIAKWIDGKLKRDRSDHTLLEHKYGQETLRRALEAAGLMILPYPDAYPGPATPSFRNSLCVVTDPIHAHRLAFSFLGEKVIPLLEGNYA